MPFKAETKTLALQDFAGLELETDVERRPPNSWTVLRNLDQFVSGAIRKVQGPKRLNDSVYIQAITAIRSYRRTPSEPLVVIGVDTNGNIFDLETGALLQTIPLASEVPFVGFMDGTLNGQTIQWLVVTTAGGRPNKWDGLTIDAPTQIGVDGPTKQYGNFGAAHVIQLGVTADPTRGLAVLVSRRYRWTFWNPVTRHESSPSEDQLVITATTTQDMSYISSSSFLTPPLDKQYITEVAIALKSGPAFNADGYTRGRLYATRDGGDVFYLVPSVAVAWTDAGGNTTVEASDEDGSFFLGPDLGFGSTVRVYDGVRDPTADPDVVAAILVPLPTEPFNNGFARVAPTDAVLVQPGPDLNENDAPPVAVWGGIYQGRLFLVPAAQPNSIVFSKIGEFESFPATNRFQMLGDEQNYIIAVDGEYQQLIIGTERESIRIVGTDFTDFVTTPLDPQVNFVGRRALGHIEGQMLFLSRQGIMSWQTEIPTFYGRSVRPLVDVIPETEKLLNCIGAVDSKRGFFLLATVLNGVPTIFLADVSQQLPFSTLGDLPGKVTALQETTIENGDRVAMLMACDDGRVYTLFEGTDPIASLAETQVLPQEDINIRKIFRRLKIQESNLDGWVYSYSVDGRPFVGPLPLRRWSMLTGHGREITLRLEHNVAVNGHTPTLSNLSIEYTTLGETR